MTSGVRCLLVHVQVSNFLSLKPDICGVWEAEGWRTRQSLERAACLLCLLCLIGDTISYSESRRKGVGIVSSGQFSLLWWICIGSSRSGERGSGMQM